MHFHKVSLRVTNTLLLSILRLITVSQKHIQNQLSEPNSNSFRGGAWFLCFRKVTALCSKDWDKFLKLSEPLFAHLPNSINNSNRIATKIKWDYIMERNLIFSLNLQISPTELVWKSLNVRNHWSDNLTSNSHGFFCRCKKIFLWASSFGELRSKGVHLSFFRLRINRRMVETELASQPHIPTYTDPKRNMFYIYCEYMNGCESKQKYIQWIC